ncbi:MAG: 50S ribosomal protein L23 [Mucispirillum sp.]|nr:50S ribosomal protein L23 [Mucispirillum sp.]
MITKYDVIRKPFLTEKAMMMQEKGLNTVVFQVHTDANKTQIKEAVEDLLKVKVEHVRTMNFKGKEKRFGRILGRRNDWKKAIVTLKEGEKLDIV